MDVPGREEQPSRSQRRSAYGCSAPVLMNQGRTQTSEGPEWNPPNPPWPHETQRERERILRGSEEWVEYQIILEEVADCFFLIYAQKIKWARLNIFDINL